VVRVKVSSFFTLKEILGKGEVKLDNCDNTIGGLLKELSKKHGEKFRKQIFDTKTGEVVFYRIVLNGRQCKPFETQLKDGDVVEFYPAMGGG